ncbi:hypothetical protein [Bradyrhizobium sp. 21]|uniref:hypothetical protein n=1 Tax=Bradyrhizobium sp. 21 TaxID=2782666 RepID=UPI001FF72B0F|nr:hypothetical protein [Bradyrhizobium sp. 21]MCK1383132.1 hypothetical protein [Bradyrhizobium sp. 21]
MTKKRTYERSFAALQPDTAGFGTYGFADWGAVYSTFPGIIELGEVDAAQGERSGSTSPPRRHSGG